MANEPERPIEKLLRAAASKRRDDAGAPLELHPATRRLLQGEAARKFAAAQRPSRSFLQGLGQLWPRFAWGLGTLAALTVIVWLLVPPSAKKEPQTLLARNQPVPVPSPTATQLVRLSKAQAISPSPPLEERAGERRPFASQPLNSIAESPTPPKEAPPSSLTAQAPAAAPPTPAAAARPTTLMLSDALSSARPTPASEVADQSQPLPKDTFGAAAGGEARERLSLATAPQVITRDRAAEAPVASPTPMPPPAPAVTANGVLTQRYGLIGQPAPPAAAAAAPGSTSPAPATPVLARAVAADEFAKLPANAPAQLNYSYQSPSAATSDNALRLLATPTDGRLGSAVALRQQARSITATQWFARVLPSPKSESTLDDKAAPAHPILASFQVEQAGRVLRIVDSDGSVYTGYLQLAGTARRQPALKAEAPAAARPSRALGAVLEEKPAASLDADQPAPPTYYFRVTGTNRSLQKKVVFTGNLLPATNLALNQPATNTLTASGSLAGYRGAAAQPALLPLLNSRISGKVVIGRGKPLDINALPSTP